MSARLHLTLHPRRVAAIMIGLAGVFLSALTDDVRAQDVAGTASVIDGDTIEIRGQRIRLFGIDAPEGRQLCQHEGRDYRCGQQAALALSDFIGRATVHCEAKDRDRYDRLVAVCHARGEDLNHWLVRQGWALAYRQYGTDYVPAEAQAQKDRLGIWAGSFIPPWEWRTSERKEASDALPRGDCRIKGNVSSKGERLYHMPDDRSYQATRIDEAQGDRWFCSETEAMDAGWRRAHQ